MPKESLCFSIFFWDRIVCWFLGFITASPKWSSSSGHFPLLTGKYEPELLQFLCFQLVRSDLSVERCHVSSVNSFLIFINWIFNLCSYYLLIWIRLFGTFASNLFAFTTFISDAFYCLWMNWSLFLYLIILYSSWWREQQQTTKNINNISLISSIIKVSFRA